MSSLYACLRSPRTPDVAVAVAKEFSPRLQRYGSDCVVLDVAGLGRLLGEPPAIGAELASRIAELSHGTRVADVSDGTRITRVADVSNGTQITRIADNSDGTRIARIGDAAHGTQIPRITDHRSTRVAVAPTQVGAMLLSSAYTGLTVVIDEIACALAPIRLEVLRDVLSEIHGATLLGYEPPQRSASRVDQRSAKSASRVDQPSARSASRGDQPSARSASRGDQPSAKSASRVDQRSASPQKDPRPMFEVLDRWGLSTLGDLAALPSGALSARLGQAGILLQRMARGVDASPLMPDPDVPRFLERVELEWPIDGLEPLAFVLARLLEPLSAALERADRAAAAIHLDLRLVDRTGHTRTLQLPAAMRDPKVLRTLLVLDLESHPPGAAIDIVSIEVDPAPGRVLQYSLLERARPSPETLATLTARLGALVGEARAGQPVLLDSHGPDAFEMRRFAPDEAARTPVANVPVASAFRPKNPLADAVLRRFRPPVAIRVAVERGRPGHVFIDRRGMPGGHVEQCAGPWRSSGAWWKEKPGEMLGEISGASRPWNRDEWDVALSDGSVCRLFHARDTDHWFLDGVID